MTWCSIVRNLEEQLSNKEWQEEVMDELRKRNEILETRSKELKETGTKLQKRYEILEKKWDDSLEIREAGAMLMLATEIVIFQQS
jgi:chaperonin cofactor prefoldin